ncbi:thiol reductase thioredoxin [Thalassobacillus devorans]|uniref:Thiol reductase thioredoxin n=1 Tax=Thalassobacillus devorans TaxID=279813 RepID=A0ABQ1PBQ1_9BACI|nr:thioredoxin family protein [Thalassobacillus devorans]NIK29943.1 thiol-disulfide isomerase/thioredoxin [Thalassobacillus devorans]GGC94083.1 thiol reductase thioredoxin [Thalassobacillus devorans]
MEQLKSEEQFHEYRNHDKVIMLFSADWCPDCRFIEPFLPELEEKYKDYTFLYVDRDEFLDICVDYGVLGIPSFVAFDKGVEIGRFVSKQRKTKEEIETFIDGLQK